MIEKSKIIFTEGQIGVLFKVMSGGNLRINERVIGGDDEQVIGGDDIITTYSSNNTDKKEEPGTLLNILADIDLHSSAEADIKFED